MTGRYSCVGSRYIGFHIKGGLRTLGDDKGLQKSTASTLVLVVLRTGARHGYDIAREVERRSDQLLTFNHGTLYPVLHALERAGLIESAWEQPDGERKRRVYTLTEMGLAEADRAIDAWTQFATAMNKVIEGGGNEERA